MYMTKLDSENSKIPLNDINLFEVTEEIATRFNVVAAEKGILIKNYIDPEMYLRLRDDQVFMIFSNLISNALRYAKSMIKIEGFVTEASGEGKLAVIEVEDDGAGFDEDEIPWVFDRFFKGDKGLSGLGLSIVKGIVESNGGKVNAFNKDSAGACVPSYLI